MQIIETNTAPAAIGTYSQAVIAGGMAYISGQIPLDPHSMELCSVDIVKQIDQVFHNVSMICKASGGELANIVKLNVYLLDLGAFALVNAAMERYFTRPYPARAIIGIASLPRNAQIEVDAIMHL